MFDCANKVIFANFYYDKTTWLDGNGNPFPFGKVTLRGCDLGDLINQFYPSNLTELDLSDNFIRNINSSYFANLQNMVVLDLSRNNIETLKPGVFKGKRMDGDDYPLQSLTTLKLSNNKIHTLDADLFEHIEQRLEVLDLSYNPLKVIDHQTIVAIGSIIYLKELNLAFTKIQKLPDHFLHTPKYLKVLDLSGNNFMEVPDGLSESHELEVLYFNNNPIRNITAENSFPNVSTLKVLYMCEMIDLECLGARSLSKLVSLEELHVCNNLKLTHIDPAALSRVDVESEIWPPLKKLYLEDNELPTLDMHFVLHWERLTELDLRYNPWTCECENQWFVDELMPMYLKINASIAKSLKCGAPVEMEGKTFYEEYIGNKTMRCLDMYGNRPERDATILIGILVGLLIGIPLVLFIIFAYQKHWFGVFDSSPASYSRQFYSRTRSDEL